MFFRRIVRRFSKAARSTATPSSPGNHTDEFDVVSSQQNTLSELQALQTQARDYFQWLDQEAARTRWERVLRDMEDKEMEIFLERRRRHRHKKLLDEPNGQGNPPEALAKDILDRLLQKSFITPSIVQGIYRELENEGRKLGHRSWPLLKIIK